MGKGGVVSPKVREVKEVKWLFQALVIPVRTLALT